MNYVFVSAGCTGQLQPSDVLVNDPFKNNLKKLFSSWYANQIQEQLNNGKIVENARVDMQISFLKPVHFQWLKQNIAWLSEQEATLLRGWKDTGILEKLGQTSN